MRISATLALVVASGLLGLTGCSGTPTDGSRFSLPSFDAPEQWEPELEDTTSEAAPEP